MVDTTIQMGLEESPRFKSPGRLQQVVHFRSATMFMVERLVTSAVERRLKELKVGESPVRASFAALYCPNPPSACVYIYMNMYAYVCVFVGVCV
jgi:hypothetical protein